MLWVFLFQVFVEINSEGKEGASGRATLAKKACFPLRRDQKNGTCWVRTFSVFVSVFLTRGIPYTKEKGFSALRKP